MARNLCLMMLLVMMMVVTACGGSNSSNNTSEQLSNNKETGTTDEKVTLTYATWGGAADTATPKVIELFNRTHPNIEVTLESTPNK